MTESTALASGAALDRHAALAMTPPDPSLQGADHSPSLRGADKSPSLRGAAGDAAIQLPHVEPHNTSAWAQYTVQVDNRDQVQQRLKAAGIPTTVHYPIPLNQQPAVADTAAQLPLGDAVAQRVISLPMHPYLDAEAQQRIALALTMAQLDASLTQ